MELRHRWNAAKRALAPTRTRADDVTHTSITTLEGLLNLMNQHSGKVNPAKIVREGYQQNLNVYTNIQKLATAAKAVPWEVKTEQPNGDLEETRPDHPVQRLLDRPNPWHTWEYMVEHFIGSMVLTGDAYALLNGPDGAPPREILPLPPHQVEPDIPQNTQAGPVSYTYTPNNGVQQTLPVENVVHVWSWSPEDMFHGQGSIQPSATDVDLLNQFRKWNHSLTRKGAQPSMVAWSEQKLGDVQFQRLKKQLQDQHGGSENAGEMLLMEELAGVDTSSFTPKEMNWVAGLREERRDLAVAMGVPPELVGDPEVKTYNNAKRAQLAIYQQKAFPMLRQISQTLQQKLRAFPDLDQVFVGISKEDTPAVQEQRRETMDALVQGVRFGIITPNEAREMLGVEPIDEGADELLRPMSLAPAGGDVSEDPPPTDPAIENDDESESDEARWLLLNGA